MSKGITYFATEPDGFVHRLFRGSHDKPLFSHAVVRAPHCMRHNVSWFSTRSYAQLILGDLEKMTRDGTHSWPDAKLYIVTSREGRHKAP